MEHDGVTDPFTGAMEALVAARAAWRASGSTFDGMAAGVLVTVNERLGRARRFLDAAAANTAAEVARQSRAELGRDGLARKEGYRTPAQMVAATTGVTMGDAARLLHVGEATAARTALSGQPLPARRRHVARAVASGTLGSWAAGQIVKMLDRVAARCTPGDSDQMERLLVGRAPGLTCEQLSKLLVRGEATLDPDGLEPKEDELRTGRSLRIRQNESGAVTVSAMLDPESGAYVKAALEGLVTASYRRSTAAGPDEAGSGEADRMADAVSERQSGDVAPGGRERAGTTASEARLAAGCSAEQGAVVADERSSAQRYADALVDVCRHALGCDAVPLVHATTTVVVRMSLDELRSGDGQALIDGVDQPVTITTARRMAASGNVIPCVLGAGGEILDWGRVRRVFTSAQRLALAERDGGCAFCGLPPAFCEAHHVRWWERDRGPTDLANGILLCTRCHHRVHEDGWTIRIEGRDIHARTWFIPPAWLDIARTPRPGGRRRYDLVA